ncbi:MAG: hypothetical protein IT375_05480 [Polyangiaceae bacterium]|nr:hypothetical protein [Polyangiaceae bacterium]
MQLKTVLLAGSLAFLAGGCSSSPSNGAAGSGGSTNSGGTGAGNSGGAGGSSGAGGGTAHALDCPGIFGCASKCADNDTPCEDACYAAGSSPAKVAVDAIVACVQEFACADEACITTHCEAMLIECVKPSGASRPPPGGPPTSGSVPAELLGQWAEGAPKFPSYTLVFGQAGALTRLREATVGVCQSKGTETGLAEANASTMKLTFTESHFVNCGTAQDSTEPYQEEYSYVLGSVPVDEWSPLGIKLEIQQINCPGYCESKSLAKIQ